MFLSFFSKSPSIIDEKTNKVIKGTYKNNLWIYNNLKEGSYII